ncbi:hypothetical protein FPZ12_038835 [Amycolatopsis acidicola]|uniref:Mce-associated membrane protein n=1 Tax=Amycolatopsis acidicola TaxID=2596893 RepID=A0A5N0US10_9PSEU|nr:hypothetical protein FPZ12_038835 [Amycolatopsis acidicola]
MKLGAVGAVIVLAAGFSVLAGLNSARSDNAAVADTAATGEVVDQVSAAVKSIFSYDYDNLDRTQRAATNVLVDAAVGQYQASFTAAKQQATEQKLVRSTTIGSIGVQELSGSDARLLLFLNQQTLNTANNQQSSAAACLSVVAKKVDGTWKIASMTAL